MSEAAYYPNPRNRSRCPEPPPETRPSARSAEAATICIIVATISAPCRDLRVRRDRLSADLRKIAHPGGTRLLQAQAQVAAWIARLGEAGTRGTAILGPPNGRHAHGLLSPGTCLPEKEDHSEPEARNIIDRLMASLGSMLLYWYHFSVNGKRIDVETDDDSVGGHFLHLLHGEKPPESWVRAMHTSLNLYAEHEFNASTFTGRVIAGTGSDMYSAITGAIGALRGPKHGGANEVAFHIQSRYHTADEAEADIRERVSHKEIIIGFGHPVYTISDPRNDVIKRVARGLAEENNDMRMFEIAERIESVMGDPRRCSPTSTGSPPCRTTRCMCPQTCSPRCLSLPV